MSRPSIALAPLAPSLALCLAVLPALSSCDDGPSTASANTFATERRAGDPIYADFGTIDLGDSVTKDIEIPIPDHDLGDIVVDTFVGNCSCAIGMLMIQSADGPSKAIYGLPADQRTLAPGDKVILRLTLDAKDREPEDLERTLAQGSVRFQLLSGAHTRSSRVFLGFHYGIRTRVKVEPVAHINFDELPMSSPPFHQVLELSNNIPGQKLELGQVYANPSCISARLEKRTDKTLLHVAITPVRDPDTAVPIKGTIVIATGIDDYPNLRIAVTGSFIGDIQYQPASYVSYNIFDMRKPREMFVNITDHDRRRPAGFVVHSIESNNGIDISEHFDIRFSSLSERKSRVYIKYLGTMGGNEIRGWLRLAKPIGSPAVAQVEIKGHHLTRQ